jgi:hypothetical protein
MKKQNRSMQILITQLVLSAGVLGVCAQEPLPPPPVIPGQISGQIFIAGVAAGPGGKVVTGAPYSAQSVTETTQTLADGNRIHHQITATVYRDSQGRTRREETLGDLGPGSAAQTQPQKVISINDPVAGASYVLNPEQHVAFKMTAGEHDFRYMASNKTGSSVPPPGEGPEGAVSLAIAGGPLPGGPPDGGGMDMMYVRTEGFIGEGKNQAGTTESLGKEMIEGVEATGTRTTVTIPAGHVGNEQPLMIVTERWYSPVLQMVVMSKRSDPRLGVTTYRLTNINLDEPAPDLFQVPADYTLKEGPATFKVAKPPASQ